MDKIPSIPSVPSGVDKAIGAIVRPMREALIQLTSGTDRAVTVGEMKTLGLIADETPDGRFKPPAFVDTSPPPKPSNLRADGALANIMLSWDAVVYANMAYTEIWAAQVNSFADAQLIGRGDGITYVDNVGAAAVKYYWIRFVSKAGVTGPFNSQVGTRGETSVDPDYILTVLHGSIKESELYVDLATKINTSYSYGAAIQQEQSIRMDETGKLFAKYTVKIDNNGYVTGYGLASTLNNAVPTSEFAVRADKFYIASPSGPGVLPTMPFVVITTPYYEDGVTLVQPGVYITNAVIADGTIKRAKIGLAAIDTARIADLAVTNAKVSNLSADKITTGYLDAARIDAGTITAAKIAANAVTADKIAASAVTANKINVTALSAITANLGNITAGDLYSTTLHGGGGYPHSSYSWPTNGGGGYHLSSAGLLLGNANNGKYFQISADGNVFAPGMSIVDGALTISQANVINTLQIANEAVTLPRSAASSGNTVSVSIVLSAPSSVFVIGCVTQPDTSNVLMTYQTDGGDVQTAAAETPGSGQIVTIQRLIYLPAGTTTVTYSSNGGMARNANIILIGCKK